jgi:hypothetical protein
MTTSLNRGSAKIYQFPARVRSALGSQRDDAKSGENAAAPNLPSRFPSASFGGAWYHEEAVQDAERAGKV